MSENKTETIPSIKHEVGVTIRFDWTSLKELDSIARYEREKRAVIMRRILVEKIQVYEHNPAYKRWQKTQRPWPYEKEENKDR